MVRYFYFASQLYTHSNPKKILNNSNCSIKAELSNLISGIPIAELSVSRYSTSWEFFSQGGYICDIGVVVILKGEYSLLATKLDSVKWNNYPPSPQSNDEGAKEQKRAILASLNWGWVVRSRCSIYFVQDCSSHIIRIDVYDYPYVSNMKLEQLRILPCFEKNFLSWIAIFYFVNKAQF